MEIAAAGEDHKALRGIARNLIAIAGTPEGLGAIKEIADRLDGKVPQGIEGGDDDNPIKVLQRIERVIVDPKHTDG